MKKKILIIAIVIIVLLCLVIAIPFINVIVKTNNINTDYSYLKEDSGYNKKVEVTNIELVSQKVSCGYASIEMVSSFYNEKVTEEELDSRNKKISTSSSKGFLEEINKSITSKSFVMKSYLKNDDFLKEIYNSLENNNPVVIEWAALYEGEWTLHFSVVTGLDLSDDLVTIYNPYGYIENIGVDEFISRTSFKAYSNMPLFLKFGFAFGAFKKNTCFYAK